MRRPPPCSYFIAFFRIMSFLWGGSAHTLGQAAAARCSCLLAYHPQSSKPLPVFTILAIQFCPFGQKWICWSGPALDKSDSMVPTEATPSTESPRKGASTPLAPTVVPVGTVCSPAAAQTPSSARTSRRSSWKTSRVSPPWLRAFCARPDITSVLETGLRFPAPVAACFSTMRS